MGRKKLYESREEYSRIRYQEKKEYYKATRAKNNNPEKNKEYSEKFKQSNKYMVASKEWNKNNRERINQRVKERKQNNPILKLQDSVTSTINHYLKEKSQKTNEYLGCSYEEYYVYLEKQFTEEMNWDNYGKYWEIDHTKPLSKGGSFHYTNTTPMIISENRSKSNKYKE
jgi:hypothetical protein